MRMDCVSCVIVGHDVLPDSELNVKHCLALDVGAKFKIGQFHCRIQLPQRVGGLFTKVAMDPFPSIGEY